MDIRTFIDHNCEIRDTGEGTTSLFNLFEMIVWYMNILAFLSSAPRP